MLEIPVEAAYALAAVTVYYIDIPIRWHRNISGIGPIEFLRGRTLLLNVPDGIEDFSLQVGFINASAEFPGFWIIRVLGPIDELVMAFLAPVETVRGLLNLVECVPDAIRKILAPGFEQFAVRIEDCDAWIGGARGDIHAVFRIDDDATTEPIFHTRRQLAPARHRLVSMLAGPDSGGVGLGPIAS